MIATAVLALVTLQRLAELVYARRNTQRLLGRGGREAGSGHYPFIILVHTGWLGALWLLAPGREVHWPLLFLFLLLQPARLWVIAALGGRWTTRIIVMPGERLVRRGPYRFVKHPNYLIVAAEIALLPLAFGLVTLAITFTLANAVMLWIRISEEERALTQASASAENGPG